MSQSTSQTTAKKAKPKPPAKPYKDFPLFAHQSGRWCKKILGKHKYFGRWDDPDAAIALYQSQREDLYAGRRPRVDNEGLTVRSLMNRFLTAKRNQISAGELSGRSFAEYHDHCKRIINAFGPTRLVKDLAADDFEEFRASLAKTRGPVSMTGAIQRIRTIFKFAHDSGFIDQPVRYSPSFKRPGKAVLRKAQLAGATRMFEAGEIRKLIDAAPIPMGAMILLGVNAGLGNTDCGYLCHKHLDLDNGWLDFPRPKTGIGRRAALWPETIAAILEALEDRRLPKNEAHADRIFITRARNPWIRGARVSEDGKVLQREVDTVSPMFRIVLDETGLHQSGRGFYGLRHSFETIAGDSTDQVAVDYAMGHVDASMASNYRHRIEDWRLLKISNHVHDWLFSESAVLEPPSPKLLPAPSSESFCNADAEDVS